MLVQALLPQGFDLSLPMLTEDFPMVLFDNMKDLLVSRDLGWL
jgi:hypothetical protein